MSAQKHMYVVLGMPRSGTSAITRGLKALGVDLGSDFGVGNNKWNPTGFWEDKEIVYKINRGVSFALNDIWMSIHLIDEQCRQNPVLNDLREAATELLKKRMAAVQYWGFKDPRTSRILPFWQEVFATLNVDDNYIVALRNPLASAASWQKLSGLEIEVGLLVWLIHLIPAIDGIRGKKALVVSYDLMMQDSRLQLERIKTKLAIPTLTEQADIDAYADHYLDKKLQHYEYDLEDLKQHPATLVAPICVKVYELLLRLAKDEIDLEGSEFSSAWQEVKNEFNQLYPIYSYMNRLLEKNKKWERELRSIRRSIPWKLIYPLRIMDDALRFMRRKARAKRKLMVSAL